MVESTSADDTGSAERLISGSRRGPAAAGPATFEGSRATMTASSTAKAVTTAKARCMPPRARRPKASGGPDRDAERAAR